MSAQAPGPRLGEFDHQVALGAFEADFRRLHPSRTPKSLALDAGWLNAIFRDEDGNIYAVLRKVAGYWSGPLSIFSNQDRASLEFDARGLETHVGQLEIEVMDQAIAWRSGIHQTDPAKALEIIQDNKTCLWREGSLLDVRGEQIGPGMQWYDSHPDGGLYACHPYRAEGTLAGRPVTGWFGYDFIYHPPHRPWHEGPYPNRLEVAWHNIFNAYDDGSVEVGMMCYGLEGWSFVLISDGERLLHCTRDVDIEIVEGQDRFPRELLYHFDGVSYRWKSDPRGCMTGAMGLFNGVYRGAEGHCQRVDDARRIVCGTGWVDYFSDGRGGAKIVESLSHPTSRPGQ